MILIETDLAELLYELSRIDSCKIHIENECLTIYKDGHLIDSIHLSDTDRIFKLLNSLL